MYITRVTYTHAWKTISARLVRIRRRTLSTSMGRTLRAVFVTNSSSSSRPTRFRVEKWFDEGLGRPENITKNGKIKGFILPAALMREMFIHSIKIQLKNGDLFVKDFRATIPKLEVLRYSF